MRNFDISVKDALNLPNTILVDLRSPTEYKEGHIPGAINLPLLTDEERIQVGTVYCQVSHMEARHLGLKIISPKLPYITEELYNMSKSNNVIIYCWRGGLRSKSILNIAKLLDIKIYRLIGGYKAYRKHVFNYLQKPIDKRFIILDGLTGVGKTDILKELDKKGLPVLDIEQLAQNRGSVFGFIGLENTSSQKQFEALIFQTLKKYEKFPYIFTECESKRIGKVFIPDSIWNNIQNGKKILVYSSLENRVERLIKTYTDNFLKNKKDILAALEKLIKRLGNDKIKSLTNLINNNNMKDFVKILLIDYYDPLYKYPATYSEKYEVNICSDNIDTAIDQLINYGKSL